MKYHVLIFAILIAAGAEAQDTAIWDFPDGAWDRKDCLKIINESPWSVTVAMAGYSSYLEKTYLNATWHAIPVMKAIARFKQINERMTDEERELYFESLMRPGEKPRILFSIDAGGGLDIMRDHIKFSDEKLSKRIFLQIAADEKRFIRPEIAQWSGSERILAQFVNLKDGEKFINETTGEVELVINLSKENVFKFNVQHMMVNGVLQY